MSAAVAGGEGGNGGEASGEAGGSQRAGLPLRQKGSNLHDFVCHLC